MKKKYPIGTKVYGPITIIDGVKYRFWKVFMSESNRSYYGDWEKVEEQLELNL